MNGQSSGRRSRSKSLRLRLMVAVAMVEIAAFAVMPGGIRAALDRAVTAWELVLWVGGGFLVLAIGFSEFLHREPNAEKSSKGPQPGP